MFFRKKKKEEKIEINSKFKLGETVRFKYHNEPFIGTICNVYKLNEDIVYDVMVGGECAFVAHKIEENNVFTYSAQY